MALEHVAGTSLDDDENTCDRQSTCYQTVLRFDIWLKEIFSDSICLGLMKNKHESNAVLISAAFCTCEPLTHQRCSKTGAFGHSSNHICQSQKLLKYLSCEADLFLKNLLNFL